MAGWTIPYPRLSYWPLVAFLKTEKLFGPHTQLTIFEQSASKKIAIEKNVELVESSVS
jgi:hypothetical protein